MENKTIFIKKISNEEYCQLLQTLKIRLDMYSSLGYKIEDDVEKELLKPSINKELYLILKTEGGEILIVRMADKVFFTYSGNSLIINNAIE